MRRLLLMVLALCLVPWAARAADRTETIRLTYLRAGELEQWLRLPAPPLKNLPEDQFLPAALDGPRFGHGGVPNGLTAWTANDQTNTLTVSGTAAAITQLRRIVRMVDIPPRRLRITARLVQLDAAAGAALRKRAEPLASPDLSVLHAEEADRKVVEALPALAEATMEVANHRRLNLAYPTEAGKPVGRLVVVPRVNGDNSITLGARGSYSSGGGEKEITVVRRLQSGAAILMLDNDQRLWLLAPTILADPVK